MRLRDKIRYAQTLADFCNLEPKDELRFRRRECEGSASEHPFVPPDWFDYRPSDYKGNPSDKKQWQINQGELREAWQKEFRIGQFELMGLLTSVFDPSYLTDVMLPSPSRPMFATRNEMPEEMYPYQQAVMFLFDQPWRAWLCERERCKRPFVKTHNQAKYCNVPNEENQTCASLVRAEDQKQDRIDHRSERNAKRRAKYAEEKRRRRSHAKRKNIHQK
jgi:hypothetical protein